MQNGVIVNVITGLPNGFVASSAFAPSSASSSTTATMASKTDRERLLTHLESLLSYHESSNNSDCFLGYDGVVDDREASILKRLDGLITRRKEESTGQAQEEESLIQTDLNSGTVRRQLFGRIIGTILTKGWVEEL